LESNPERLKCYIIIIHFDYQVVTECTEKIQTVCAMGGEKKLKELYSKKLTAPYK
jgi:hypothetical protein